MIRYIQLNEAPQYLLLTECSMADNIAAEHPDKNMLRMCTVRCPHMNEITLENTLQSLQQNRFQVEILKRSEPGLFRPWIVCFGLDKIDHAQD